MLSVITGKQRSGKSYYCVLVIIDYLRSCTRPIFTNLPLNPDVLADYACGGRLKHPALYNSYLHRLYIFKDFSCSCRRSRLEYASFKKNNPDYVGLHKNLLRSGHRLLINQEKIREFWRVILPNSIVFLDELYQWFSSSEAFNSNSDVKAMRKELLTYTRQHGHFKDDMYLISHSEADLDVNIRRGIQRLFIIRNSKYTNISENIRIKWFIQFFIVKAYEYGEKKYTDKYNYFSNKKIFKCYDSFSAAETLGKGVSLDSASNTDSGVDNKENIKNFFRQSGDFILLIVLVSIILVVAGFYIKDYLFKPTSINFGKAKTKSEKKAPVVSASDFHKVVFISPSAVIFDDKYKLNKGDFIYGCKVEKFCRDYAVLSFNGKSKRISYSGLRLREKVKETGKKGNGNKASSKGSKASFKG